MTDVEVVLDRARLRSDEKRAKRTSDQSCLLKCLRCKCPNTSDVSDTGLGSIKLKGLNWMCEQCFVMVEGGCDREGEIARSVTEGISSYVDILADKIAGRLELNGTMTRDSQVGDRSFADVVRKPAAKIVVSNAGDSFIKDASEALKETPVSFMKADKTGNVTIALPDEDILNSARGRLRDIIPSSANTKTVVKLPKITVRDFPLPPSASVGERDRNEMDCEIMSLIRMKNKEVKEWIDEGHTCEVVYVGRARGRERASVGLRVSCTIRDFLLNRGNLYVGNVSCRVEERNYIPQCFMCQRFGHKAFECNQEAPTCMHCAESHPSRDCSNRRNICCSNCRRSSDPNVQRCATSHNAASTDCPVYIRRLRMQKN